MNIEHPTSNVEVIETEPFTVPGTKLFVNVDAVKGDLRVKVLNKAGQSPRCQVDRQPDLSITGPVPVSTPTGAVPGSIQMEGMGALLA